MDYLGHRWAGPLLASVFYFQDPGHWHWFSDMVAGGIFGYWLASSILDSPNQKETASSSSQTSIFISPYNGGLSVNLTYQF